VLRTLRKQEPQRWITTREGKRIPLGAPSSRQTVVGRGPQEQNKLGETPEQQRARAQQTVQQAPGKNVARQTAEAALEQQPKRGEMQEPAPKMRGMTASDPGIQGASKALNAALYGKEANDDPEYRSGVIAANTALVRLREMTGDKLTTQDWARLVGETEGYGRHMKGSKQKALMAAADIFRQYAK